MAMVRMPHEVLVRLGVDAHKIFSLDDYLSINGARVVGIREAEGKVVYDCSDGVSVMGLVGSDFVTVLITALQKYKMAAGLAAPVAQVGVAIKQVMPSGHLVLHSAAQGGGIPRFWFVLAGVVILCWAWGDFFKGCQSAFDDGLDNCNSKYHGKCSYVSKKYQPTMCFANGNWISGNSFRYYGKNDHGYDDD